MNLKILSYFFFAGAVLLGGAWLMWISHKKDSIVFKKWKWSAFSVLMIWCVGLKEVWEIQEENFSEGLVEHSMGWPLSDGRT